MEGIDVLVFNKGHRGLVVFQGFTFKFWRYENEYERRNNIQEIDGKESSIIELHIWCCRASHLLVRTILIIWTGALENSKVSMCSCSTMGVGGILKR
ncbi:hypothetical protein Ccrd_016562 [Cynara cardunculus var. scolymus]|uniref:Uncharacterized protein n=1 Tax=Cynara cardunculus var. scolymus TaxID=59895 RepID=A0A103Y9R9_CYNCS|nr:hypothetical protein Ccrd_016562 [Cynara cardunculus var. scolymus]